jgi:hypothetical protein
MVSVTFQLCFGVRRISCSSITPITDGLVTDGLEVRRTIQLAPNLKLRQSTRPGSNSNVTPTLVLCKSRVSHHSFPASPYQHPFSF